MAVAPTSREAELLKTRVPINTLSDKDRAALLEKIGIEHLKRGEYLFRQGDTDSKNVYLLSGSVDLLLDKKVVDTITDGLETARFALAHQFPRKYAAIAKGPVTFVGIDSQMLSGLLSHGQSGSNTVEADEGDDEDWMTQLLMSSVVQHIPPANIQNVMMRMERVEVKAGEEIVKQGDEGSYFFLINKGRCAVSRKQNSETEAEELARLGPGDNFGEEALLSNSPRGCSIIMLTDGVLFRLGKEDFTTFIQRPLTKDVTYEEACKVIESGGIWLDVREPDDYERNGLDGSKNMPLHSLRFQADSLTLDQQYVIYCADGSQSAVAAFLLLERGVDVTVLKGGIDSIPQAEPAQTVAPQESTTSQQDSGGDATDTPKLVQERDEAQKQVQLLEQRLAETTQKYEQVQSKLIANVATLKQAVQDLKEKLKAAQSGESVQGDNGENASLMQKVEELENKKAELDQRIKKMESNERQLNAELEILLEASEENDKAGLAEVTQLKDQISDLQQQLKDAKG